MKYFKAFVLLIFLVCLFFMMSCTGDGNPALSNTQLLAGVDDTGKTWRITGIETDLGTVDPFDCVSDNNITYFPNGRYEVNEGASKCDPSDPVAFIGDWDFSSQENQLSVVVGDSARIWVIVELREQIHRIESSFPDGQRTYVLRPL